MKFVKGDDYQESGATVRTFGITQLEGYKVRPDLDHTNKIEVMGDEKLRDLIIDLLNQESMNMGLQARRPGK
jgi:hypothetical protein